MDYVYKTYVEFWYRGLLTNDSMVKTILTRDVSKLEMPERAYGFKFFDILSVVVEADGKQVELTSERINVSPMHYFGGTVYTVAEIKRDFAHATTLISNIEDNGFKKAIRCRTGNWQPLEETDIFVEAS